MSDTLKFLLITKANAHHAAAVVAAIKGKKMEPPS